MVVKSLLLGVGILASPFLFALGCSGETPAEELCVPGQTIECACPGGVKGVQSCTADGSGFSPCSGCTPGDATTASTTSGEGGAGSTVTTGMGGATTTSPASGPTTTSPASGPATMASGPATMASGPATMASSPAASTGSGMMCNEASCAACTTSACANTQCAMQKGACDAKAGCTAAYNCMVACAMGSDMQCISTCGNVQEAFNVFLCRYCTSCENDCMGSVPFPCPA